MNANFVDKGGKAWVMSTTKRPNFFSQGRSEVSDSYVETRFGLNLRTGEQCMHAVAHSLGAISTATPAPSLFQTDFSHCSFPEAVRTIGCPFSNRVVGTLPYGKVSRAPVVRVLVPGLCRAALRTRHLERVHESF